MHKAQEDERLSSGRSTGQPPRSPAHPRRALPALRQLRPPHPRRHRHRPRRLPLRLPDRRADPRLLRPRGNDANGNDDAYPAEIALGELERSTRHQPRRTAEDGDRARSPPTARIVIFKTAAPLVSRDTDTPAANPSCRAFPATAAATSTSGPKRPRQLPRSRRLRQPRLARPRPPRRRRRGDRLLRPRHHLHHRPRPRPRRHRRPSRRLRRPRRRRLPLVPPRKYPAAAAETCHGAAHRSAPCSPASPPNRPATAAQRRNRTPQVRQGQPQGQKARPAPLRVQKTSQSERIHKRGRATAKQEAADDPPLRRPRPADRSCPAARLLAASPAASAAGGPEWKLTVTPLDYFFPGSSGHGAGNTRSKPKTSATKRPRARSPSKTPCPPGLSRRSGRILLLRRSARTKPQRSRRGRLPDPAPVRLHRSARARRKGVVLMLVASPKPSPTPVRRPHRHRQGLRRRRPDRRSRRHQRSRRRTRPSASTASPPSSPTPPATPYTQAGGHPYQLVTEFNFATPPPPSAELQRRSYWATESIDPVRDPRESAPNCPPGLIANPQAVPRCSLAAFFALECPLEDRRRHRRRPLDGQSQRLVHSLVPLYNLQPAGEFPGELGYHVANIALPDHRRLRSGSDYGITVTNTGTAQVGLNRVRRHHLGRPGRTLPRRAAWQGLRLALAANRRSTFAGELPNAGRGAKASANPTASPAAAPPNTPEVPFLTMPTECSGRRSPIAARYDSWQAARAKTPNAADSFPAAHRLQPAPLRTRRSKPARPPTSPTAPRASTSPQGPPARRAPEAEDPNGLATADLKEAVVNLPAGLVVNPSSAQRPRGLLARPDRPHHRGRHRPPPTSPKPPPTAPTASKIGTVEVKTPLLHEPLGSIEPSPAVGAVYLATPHQNPFGSLLAGYIVLEGEGLIIKLAGKFETDPQTGQITGRFLENPQTPFEEFKLHFFAGARGDLRTPAVCGTYTATSALTPYSHTEANEAGEETEATPIAEPSRRPSRPKPAPAKAKPARRRLRRAQRPAASRRHRIPPGRRLQPLLPEARPRRRLPGNRQDRNHPAPGPGRQAGRRRLLLRRPDRLARRREHEGGGAEEQASPSCPASSEVGTVDVAAGAGPTPSTSPARPTWPAPTRAPRSASRSSPRRSPAPSTSARRGQDRPLRQPRNRPDHRQSRTRSPHPRRASRSTCARSPCRCRRPDFTLNPTDCEPQAFSGSATLGPRPARPPLPALPGRRLQRPQVQARAQAQPQGLDQAHRPPGPEGGPDDEPGRRQHRQRPGHPAPLRVPRQRQHQQRLHPGPIRRPRLPGRQRSTARRWPGRPLLEKPLRGPVYLRSSG